MSKLLRLVIVSMLLTFTLFVRAQPAEASDIVHVVQRGETLFKIGLK